MNTLRRIGFGWRLAAVLLIVSQLAAVEGNGSIQPSPVKEQKIIRRPVSYPSFNKQRLVNPKSNSFNNPPLSVSGASYDLSTQLSGNWNEVSGYVCFPYHDPDLGDLYIMIVGLPVSAQGNEIYQSTGWDKKVFWMDIGDKIPMHVAGICYTNLEETDSDDFHVYFSEAFYYQKAGVDYSQYPMGGQFCVLWLVTDENNNPTDYWIDLYDEQDTLVESSVSIQPGDRIQSWTYSIDTDNPDYFYLSTMEETFRTVQSAPTFTYSHLTPNVDFPNALTKEKIDFPNVDLVYILRGRTIDADGIAQYGTSAPKPLSMKWSNLDTVQIENWLLHEISPLFGAFGRKY